MLSAPRWGIRFGALNRYTGWRENLSQQADEVERVDSFDLEEARREIAHDRERFCVPRKGLELLRSRLHSVLPGNSN